VQEIGCLSPSEKIGWEHIRLYLARYDGALRFPCSEIETGLWISIEEVNAWVNDRPQDFASGFIECWKVFDEMLSENTQNSEQA